ncbi:hypothetical protein E4U45_005571 [Claviceps purpurea]|nr:hypothetical protein E4U45_005571 [Claviceps purpurea]
MIAFWSLLNEDPLTGSQPICSRTHGSMRQSWASVTREVLSSEPMKGLLSIAQSSGINSDPHQSSCGSYGITNKSYRKRRTLVVAAITRWGTQLQMIDSVLAHEERVENGRAMIRSKLRKTDSDGWHRVVANTSDWTLKDAAV